MPDLPQDSPAHQRAWRRRRVAAPLLGGGAVASAVTTFLVSAQAGQASEASRSALLVVGAASTAVTILLGLGQHRLTEARRRTAEQIAVDAESSLTLTLNGALAPITSYLGEMADTVEEEDRAHVAGQLSQSVVAAVVELGPPGARSAFYRVDDDWQGLTREGWSGRSDRPRQYFARGTSDGDTVLDLVRSGDFVLVDDVVASPMVSPSVASGYDCVAAVAVTAGSWPLGLLTVDAPGRGSLTRADVELLRVLANLLGAGLAQV